MRTAILVLFGLCVYLGFCSLMYLEQNPPVRERPPKDLWIRAVGIRRDGYLAFCAKVGPYVSRRTRIGMGLITARIDEGVDPREIMQGARPVADAGDEPLPWECEAGVLFWSEEGPGIAQCHTVGYMEGGWFETVFLPDLALERFNATIWSGEKVWTRRNVRMRGGLMDDLCLGFAWPGMFILVMGMLYWPWVLLCLGCIGIYWSLFLASPRTASS